MEVLETQLQSVLLIKPHIFEDHRGIYVNTYHNENYKKAFKEREIDIEFVEDDLSVSRKNVLRGFHGDEKTWKLISCPLGEIYLVILNYNNESKQYGKWLSFTLSERNLCQVIVPPLHGVAHLVLSDRAMFMYKQSAYYNPDILKQFTVKYNDPRFNVWWPITNPIISIRDQS